jgi:hypothetical protein
MILESYFDAQSGKYREVTTDSETGKVLDAFAYDGSNTYTRGIGRGAQIGSDSLTIYRSQQKQISVADRKVSSGIDPKDVFESMRNDSNAQLVGQETWADGRTVFVLNSQQPVKTLGKDIPQPPVGLMTVYFDTKTYQIVGNKMTMEKDGKELVLNSQRVLLDETLPARSSVAWDLSDLQGITVVNDSNAKNGGGGSLPGTITEQELAAKTQSAYLLKTIPSGYSLEIAAPPQLSANSRMYFYIATYHNAANDYFVIQFAPEVPGMAAPGRTVPGMANTTPDETYTTASGLVLQFERDNADPSGKHFTSAMVTAPDGTNFVINSSLPRKTVKAWAEELVLVQ